MKYLLALLLIISSSWLSAQEGTPQVNAETGNIVYTTLNPPPPGAPFNWNGFVNVNTSGGGLSGGNIPAYNSQTGTFIFGYMPGTVAYTTAVNFALAAAGTGIQVNGFKYSWSYYNQDYSRGFLSGNISLTNNSGKTVESYNYLMPKTTEGWTAMSGIQNFSTQYAPPSLGNLQVSFSGQDDRFWAGYYGPQIRDIDVRLLYSTAASSPTPSTTPSTTSTTDTTSTINTIIAAAAEPVTDNTIKSTSSTNTNTEPTTVAATPVNATTNSTTIESTSISNTGAIAVIKDETQVTKEATTEKSSLGPSLNSILANIRSNQDKQNNIAMSAVAASIEVANNVTQKAEQLAVEVAQTSAQQALQTALNSSALTNGNRTTNNNIAIAENNQNNATNTSQTNVSVATINNPTFSLLTRSDSKNVSENTQSNTDLTVRPQSSTTTQPTSLGQLDFTLKPQTNVTTSTNVGQLDFTLKPQSNVAISTYVTPSLSLTRPENKVTENFVDNQFAIQEIKPILRQPTVDMFANTNSTNTNNPTLAFGKKGDPIQDYIEANNTAFNEMRAEPKSSTVRTNTQDNDIAGGVRIERMAVIPNGFNAYTNLSLSNIAFYEPKEIYKNQKVIDNARALRQLSSDRLHQEMVEQQYRR